MSVFNNVRKNLKFQLNKQDFPIGIFGSFKYNRIIHLQNLRNYLNTNNYLARLSEDLDSHFHDTDFEKPIGYDLKISRNLIDSSKIHIFVFFQERKYEHHINESLAVELAYLLSQLENGSITNPRVIIYTQKGIERDVGGLLRDLILDKKYWRDYPFNKLDDIYEHAITTCNRFISSY